MPVFSKSYPLPYFYWHAVLAFVLAASTMPGCKSKNTLFAKLDAHQSGIQFTNAINETDSTNSFINEFGYMGGGVGIGDFNNDGLKDIVFTANQSTCRIYINKGNLTFEDITEKAGLTTNVWATGVSIADVNADGYDDIYICTYGKTLLTRTPNLLFINQGNLTFTEQAQAYGLADTSYTSQAAFFDYDNDGDLDVYLANYSFNNTNTSANNIVTIDTSGNSIANDRLYRNEGTAPGAMHPTFTDVTLDAGIKEDGYGLGLAICDINKDGWPDIYVANDFVSNDRLWINQKNGSFKNLIDRMMPHQSYSSMGVDVADLNNDGWSDIVTLDMLPEWNERKKTSYSFMNYDRYRAERFKGYAPQFMRNMLQLNNGNRPFADSLPYFSEIGQMAGIAATDWSWSVLMADFDLDGFKDMHITNGVGRDFINADFLEFSANLAIGNLDAAARQKAIRDKLISLNHIPLPNYYYKNSGSYSFGDFSEDAGINQPSMSNGAAYADLDNDGDLDLIVNNINEEAFVWINNAINPNKTNGSQYLKVKLTGHAGNRHGFGTSIKVYTPGGVQYCEQWPVRGYYSSVDVEPIFGLNGQSSIDSVVVTWPDGKSQTIKKPTPNQTLAVKQQEATPVDAQRKVQQAYSFLPMPAPYLAGYSQKEEEFNDFGQYRLLLQKYSQLGPNIATADVNGDGFMDLFAGGAANQNGTLFIQTANGQFTPTSLATQGKSDQLKCVFFNANNDPYPDLLVTYGHLQAPASFAEHKPRLYLNNGNGGLVEKTDAFADSIACIAGAVAIADIDGDGLEDIFLGARIDEKYPLSPKSFVLQNMGGGQFTDATSTICPALRHAGMVTAAIWANLDTDPKPELLVAGEWMSLTIFKNNNGQLVKMEQTGLDSFTGMWRTALVADIDNDGDLDIIAGNLGLNNLYHCSQQTPMELYGTDIDGNGIIDPLHFYHIKTKKGELQKFPGISRAQFSEQVPSIKKKFLLAKDYASASFSDFYNLFKEKILNSLSSNEPRTCLFENLGNGTFKTLPLPWQAQLAPVNTIICADIDKDGFKDLLLAGNEYQAEVMNGIYTASYGVFLKGNAQKAFTYVPGHTSGLVLEGDVKQLQLIPQANGQQLLVAAINNAPLVAFKIAH